jgi:hypothetical protein
MYAWKSKQAATTKGNLRMGVNLDKPQLWKEDVAESVDLYNNWFMQFAPQAFRDTRLKTAVQVERALKWTANLTNISPTVLHEHPEVLPILRMSTAPPIARDRLAGLAYLSRSLIETMERDNRVPPRMPLEHLEAELSKIGDLIEQLADRDIFTWLGSGVPPKRGEVKRAATIVADRLCGANTDPIVRNAQEQRQLAMIRDWLVAHGYHPIMSSAGLQLDAMRSGTFIFRLAVHVRQGTAIELVNIPIDAVIMPLTAAPGALPLLIEAKSAGDFANPNKRRKEEGKKVDQLRATFGPDVRFILFLCGSSTAGIWATRLRRA